MSILSLHPDALISLHDCNSSALPQSEAHQQSSLSLQNLPNNSPNGALSPIYILGANTMHIRVIISTRGAFFPFPVKKLIFCLYNTQSNYLVVFPDSLM